MGMEMGLVEALVDADPDAEAETEDAVQQSDQNEPAVDVFHGFPSLRTELGIRIAEPRPLAKCAHGRQKLAASSQTFRAGDISQCASTTIGMPISI
jgi:hypothetical protein